MYQHPKNDNDNDNNKMATEKKRFIKYKAISGKLQENIGFKLLAGGNIKDADKVYCIHCDKSFAYHGSNTSLTYYLQRKLSLQYSKLTTVFN